NRLAPRVRLDGLRGGRGRRGALLERRVQRARGGAVDGHGGHAGWRRGDSGFVWRGRRLAGRRR
ncbi:MAG TPA: hypothetical protein DEF51_06205, partial [Myxococcales bacterium]|nr:hypothetical protein [Myxococcales bacterium]